MMLLSSVLGVLDNEILARIHFRNGAISGRTSAIRARFPDIELLARMQLTNGPLPGIDTFAPRLS